MNPEDENGPEDDIESEQNKMLENRIFLELNIVKLVDSISTVPLIMQAQQKAFLQFKSQIVDPYILINPSFEDDWREIGEEVDAIFGIVKRAIEENNLQDFFGRPNIWKNIVIMVAILVPMFILTFVLPDIALYIMIGVFPVYCAIQAWLNKRRQDKFTYILSQLNPLINEKIIPYRENLIPKIQKLINSARETINANNLDPMKFQMFLFNKDYENIEVLDEVNVRGVVYYKIKIS